MYAKGMTTRDISSHIKDIYGFGISEKLVSKITNKILPTIEEWQNRPLEKIYPMVFLDAIHYHVRENNIVVKKAVYIALGYNLEGFKEILGMWVGENESSKYWLLVLNQLKERGLEDVLIFSTDNLPGFSEAIEAVYPKAEIHPKSVGKIMYNPPNKKLNEICIMQRYKRINEIPKSSIQSTNRRLSLNKFRSL